MPFVSEKLKKCTNDLKIHYNFHDRNYTIFYFDVFYWHGKIFVHSYYQSICSFAACNQLVKQKQTY